MEGGGGSLDEPRAFSREALPQHSESKQYEIENSYGI